MLWLVAVVFWLTWAPFTAREDPVTLSRDLPSDFHDVLGNLLLFVPPAVVLASGVPLRHARGLIPLLLGASAILSMVIEAGQWYVRDRFVSPFDVLWNTLSGGIGAWLGLTLRRRGAPPDRVVLWTVATVYLAVAAYVTAGAFYVHGQTRLEGWSPEHHLLAGHEVGEQRRYEGRVGNAAVCVVAGDAGRICATGGAGPEERQRVAGAAERFQNVHLLAEVVSDHDRQDGPARIVTFSDGLELRNATLGQEGADLVLRLRMPLTGANASDVQFLLKDAIVPGVPTRVRASFEDGVVRMEAESRERRARTTLRLDALGLLDGWLLFRRPAVIEARQLVVASLATAFVLFFPLGLLACARLASAPAAAGLALGVAVAMKLGFALAVGQAPSLLELCLAAGVAGSGVLFIRGRVPWRRALRRSDTA